MTTSVALSNGLRMPQIGLGVYLVSDVAVCEASVRTALQTGYRLIDTAAAYRNEAAVGRGVRSSGVPRDEVFLTTKLWPADYGYEKAEAAIGGSLARLDCGPIDLLLLHQPVGDVRGAWRAMEEAVDSGVSSPTWRITESSPRPGTPSGTDRGSSPTSTPSCRRRARTASRPCR